MKINRLSIVPLFILGGPFVWMVIQALSDCKTIKPISYILRLAIIITFLEICLMRHVIDWIWLLGICYLIEWVMFNQYLKKTDGNDVTLATWKIALIVPACIALTIIATVTVGIAVYQINEVLNGRSQTIIP